MLNTQSNEDWLQYAGGSSPKTVKFLSEILAKYFSSEDILNVLDLGACSGQSALSFLEIGKKVTGIDINKNELDIARKNVQRMFPDRAKFLQMDASEMQLLNASFDAISSAGLISIFEKSIRKNVFSEINRVLRDGGLYYFADFEFDASKINKYAKDKTITGEYMRVVVYDNRKRTPTPKFYGTHFKEANIIRELKENGLEILDIRHTQEVSQNSGHIICPIIHIVAKKIQSLND